MACHYRIALPSAKVGLPEVLIGILPGGGGTQRLPRLIGAKAALDMIVTGRHVPAPEAKRLGIIDERAAGRTPICATARSPMRCGIMDMRPLPRVRDRAVKLDDPGIFDAMRKSIARRARNQNAPYHCIAAVEAACSLAFDDGCRREADLFKELEDCRRGTSAALRVLHRARGGAAAGHSRQHAGARLRNRRGGRRRHDGRRHRHELRRLRLPGEDHGRHAGSAGARHAAHPRQLCDLGAPRLAGRGRDAAPAGAHRTGRRLRRHRGLRPRHRGGVRGDGRQEAGVRQAGRGDEAGRADVLQHFGAGRRSACRR